jgi:xanthine dehydrogenase small subunit
MAGRSELVFFLNGQRQEVRGSDCFLSLSDFLRNRRSLTGTKIVCSEGDCGSCTVLVGRMNADGELKYLPIDSCIRLMFQMDGCHVVTIEGLGGTGSQHDAETLTAVQRAMVECHGSQCGFCTPGFVMAMTGVQNECNGNPPTEEEWRHSLTGNLCRCTGYTSIIKAGMQSMNDVTPRAKKIHERFPSGPIVAELKPLADDGLELRSEFHGFNQLALCPRTIDDALAYRQKYPNAKIVAGATDVGVQMNKCLIRPEVFLDLNRVTELGAVAVEERGAGSEGRAIVTGARASWTSLLKLCREEAPQFASILEVFGSPQIRHVGTIGGNIINASPIADSLPFLFVVEAELELASTAGRRSVNINQFYSGYKQFDLRADELLTGVRIPLPSDDELLRLFKVSRRKDLDISTFTGAIRLKLDGETIADASVAFGAVDPTVIRLRKTETFLRGEAFSEETMQTAGEIAVDEITPISDVRGSKDYRYQLAKNVFLKFYLEQLAISN